MPHNPAEAVHRSPAHSGGTDPLEEEHITTEFIDEDSEPIPVNVWIPASQTWQWKKVVHCYTGHDARCASNVVSSHHRLPTLIYTHCSGTNSM